MDKELNKRMMRWITSRDTGMSSQTLWAAIMGIEMHGPSIPHDQDDFGRCYRLLCYCDPETKEHALKTVGELHEIWKPFIKEWKTMTELYEANKGMELHALIKKVRGSELVQIFNPRTSKVEYLRE